MKVALPVDSMMERGSAGSMMATIMKYDHVSINEYDNCLCTLSYTILNVSG